MDAPARAARLARHPSLVNLLVIRHAIAQEKEAFATTGKPDDLRPLTDEGRRKMREGAAGLRALVPELDVLAASPLVRAQETARIVADVYGIGTVETTNALRPDAANTLFVSWLAAQNRDRTVAVVGHEPHLGMLVTWLMTGIGESRVELKKGAACLLEFAERPQRGHARLLWALAPAQLRKLGR
jgi:phosphohistidine phosphatase